MLGSTGMNLMSQTVSVVACDGELGAVSAIPGVGRLDSTSSSLNIALRGVFGDDEVEDVDRTGEGALRPLSASPNLELRELLRLNLLRRLDRDFFSGLALLSWLVFWCSQGAESRRRICGAKTTLSVSLL